MATTIKKYDIESIKSSYNTYCENLKGVIKPNDSLGVFTQFLQDNNLSTLHAQDIYNAIKGEVYSLPYNSEIKLRKKNRKTNAFIKKVLTPASFTGLGIGIGATAVESLKLVAGQTAAGILTVTSNPASIFINTTIPGIAIGTLATVGLITVKNALTRLYYSKVYDSAKENLNSLESGTDLENLKIVNLMNKVLATKEKILDTREGKWFTAPFRFIKRHSLNAMNRNRVHHIEKVTKQLVAELQSYNSILATDNETKTAIETKTQPILQLLNRINSFVHSDLEGSKLYAMLSCKDTDKGHKHKEIIENLDIYANLKMYLDIVKTLNPSNKIEKTARKHQVGNYKKIFKNNKQKTQTAQEILNSGEISQLGLLTKCIQRNNAKVEPIIQQPAVEEVIVETPEIEKIFEEVKQVVVEKTQQIEDEIIEKIWASNLEPKEKAKLVQRVQMFDEEIDLSILESKKDSTKEVIAVEEVKEVVVEKTQQTKDEIIEKIWASNLEPKEKAKLVQRVQVFDEEIDLSILNTEEQEDVAETNNVDFEKYGNADKYEAQEEREIPVFELKRSNFYDTSLTDITEIKEEPLIEEAYEIEEVPVVEVEAEEVINDVIAEDNTNEEVAETPKNESLFEEVYEEAAEEFPAVEEVPMTDLEQFPLVEETPAEAVVEQKSKAQSSSSLISRLSIKHLKTKTKLTCDGRTIDVETKNKSQEEIDNLFHDAFVQFGIIEP